MVFSVKNSLKKRSKQLYGNVVVIRVLDLMGLTFLSLRKLGGDETRLYEHVEGVLVAWKISQRW